jgi:superfamily II DNA or RNA helicase/HKD family nuclease
MDELPSHSCPFCSLDPARVFWQGDLTTGVWDGFPVSEGHALLIPRRHVASWFEATPAERAELVDAIEKAKAAIELRYSPNGFNIGINVGEAAGQTVFHLHVHLIPRYHGDVMDPRGGVRHVVPSKANYLAGIRDSHAVYDLTTERLVSSGGSTEPFLQDLKAQLAAATSVDIAVAFVMKSGMDLLRASIAEALDRGARVRLLTGDYLDATDPVALMQLLDLRSNSESLSLRVFQTTQASGLPQELLSSFHPKAYIFSGEGDSGTAFVGSSNLSKAALQQGVEWNYRVVKSRDGRGFRALKDSFDALFRHPATTELTNAWVEKYKDRRVVRESLQLPLEAEVAPPAEVATVPVPHSIQIEALAALQESRLKGESAGLVVLATGLGKTWLSAFDSLHFDRVLFVAHREEILNQAMQTFRQVRPLDYLGHYAGQEKHPNAKVLFASIQTLGRQVHLNLFDRTGFDYIVVDEFHHASAATYRRLLQHFEPRYLLGLTATPERSDGADLLELCDGNLVFRCDLPEGIRRELLCAFDYFGVPDEVDYTNIPWRSRRFDEESLTNAVATVSRAENALDQLLRRGGNKVIAFCVSRRHANFMAGFFRANGKRAVAVHSGADSAPRTISLEQLQAGELDIVCAVDMFNEGVDLPDLDTVMMLRPTESKILWLQQFGRGLRRSNPEKRLAVIDYIGNHRTFLLKPQTLFGLPAGDQNIQNLLERLQQGTAELPAGCSVTYDLGAIDILRGLLRVGRSASESLRTYVKDFIDLHGVRPTALETYRDGYSPRAVRQSHGSWHRFLDSVDGLGKQEPVVQAAAAGFLDSLEVTQMVKSYKMVVLLGMLNGDRFPGEVGIEELTAAVRKLGMHQPAVAADFGAAFTADASLRAHLEVNPIAAWAGGAGTGGHPYFAYADGVFSSEFAATVPHRDVFQELVRELVEWRLAEYLDRPSVGSDEGIQVRVNQANGNPILMPIDREKHPELPEGWAPVRAGSQDYRANFVKIAINVLQKGDADRNELPGVLRGWFGPDAGAPGTRHSVQLTDRGAHWELKPIGGMDTSPTLWKAYSREQIPGLFGLTFDKAVWQQGFVRQKDKTFLLVTLDKASAAEEHKYEDKFMSPKLFAWQSQNRTDQKGGPGQSIKNHKALGIAVHLFVRQRSKKADSKASPFIYCGIVDFVSWKDNKPISVEWELRDAVPERLRAELRVLS